MTIEAISSIVSSPEAIAPLTSSAEAAGTTFDSLMQSFESLNARMQAEYAAHSGGERSG